MKHIIRKKTIEVYFNGPESAGAVLPNRFSDLCRNWLMPVLDRTLDRCAPEGGHLFFDYLELDIGTLSSEHLEQELPVLVGRALESAILTKKAALSQAKVVSAGFHPARFETEAQATWAAFIFFLETGRLPWMYALPAGENLEKKVLRVLADWSGTRLLRDELPTGTDLAVVRKRLVRQFTLPFLESLTGRIAPASAALAWEVLSFWKSHLSPELYTALERMVWVVTLLPDKNAGFSRSPAHDQYPEVALVRGEAWHILAQTLTETRRQLPDFVPAFRDAVRQGRVEPWMEEMVLAIAGPETGPAAELPPEMASRDVLPDAGLILDHTGLVLLHPFLPQFFRSLSIVEDSVLVQPDRALHLLHFLATGVTNASEYELTFAKILCGIPLRQPVEAAVGLTEEECAEAINLLQTVIRYWDALKNTSADGLRETFLRRSGKLSPFESGDWLLQVETQTHDVLLDRLPWGIAMIKLPWMPSMLRVEWE